MAAGQQLGLVAVLGEQRHGLVGGSGPDIVESGRDHEATRDGLGWPATGVGHEMGPGVSSSTPAVMNAIADALSPYGITDIAMPATPERVWQAIQASKGAPA